MTKAKEFIIFPLSPYGDVVKKNKASEATKAFICQRRLTPSYPRAPPRTHLIPQLFSRLYAQSLSGLGQDISQSGLWES